MVLISNERPTSKLLIPIKVYENRYQQPCYPMSVMAALPPLLLYSEGTICAPAKLLLSSYRANSFHKCNVQAIRRCVDGAERVTSLYLSGAIGNAGGVKQVPGLIS